MRAKIAKYGMLIVVASLVFWAGTYVVETGAGRYYQDTLVAGGASSTTTTAVDLAGWAGITSVVVVEAAATPAPAVVYLYGAAMNGTAAAGDHAGKAIVLEANERFSIPMKFEKLSRIAALGDSVATCASGTVKITYFGE